MRGHDTTSAIRMQTCPAKPSDATGAVRLQLLISVRQDHVSPGKGGVGRDADFFDAEAFLQESDVSPTGAAEAGEIGRRDDEVGFQAVGIGYSGRDGAVPPFDKREQGGGRLQEKGGFHERPEGRMERPRDDGPRFFQLPCGLEAETDDGNPRRGQRLESIFTEIRRLREGQGPVRPLMKGLGEGGVPEDERGMDPDHIRTERDGLKDGFGETVGAVPGQTGHQMDSRFETLFP
jgi:hypothetical protein